MRRLPVLTLVLAALLGGALTVAVPTLNPADNQAEATWGAAHWPASGRISSRVEDRCPGYDNHHGYDIAGNYRSVVSAAYSGTVGYIGWDPGGYGNYVIIDHVNGWSTLYAHLDGYVSRMRVGEYFARDAGIGYMGYTGGVSPPGVSGTHLHFEVHRYGSWTKWNSAGSCNQNVSRTAAIPFDFAGLT